MPEQVMNKRQLENLRKIRAYSIIAKGDMPKEVNSTTWVVPSQSTPDKTYTIWKENTDYHCDCPDHKETGLLCKHIQSTILFHKMQEGLDDTLTLKAEIDHPQCPRCNSYEIVKQGQRKTKSGNRQRYHCKQCQHRFVLEPIKHRKATTKLIALAMDLYYKGLSLRKIADTFEQFYNLSVHHDTIRVWIDTFMEQITKYVNQYNPTVGEIWNLDEQKVKSEGEWVYSWNIMDKKTRYLIANNVTKQRSIFETKGILKKAMINAETRPTTIVTDGMTAYPSAIKDMYEGTEHIHNAGIRDVVNNNTLERYHGTWRERDKVMRGMQNDETTKRMLENYRTYYNFVREHSVLGKTPSEEAGIELTNNKNKWMGLIEKALCPANPTGDVNVP